MILLTKISIKQSEFQIQRQKELKDNRKAYLENHKTMNKNIRESIKVS